MKDYKNRQPEMSMREIERRYSKLTIEAAKPNVTNCYVCDSCRTITKTIDIHIGATPMIINCINCNRLAYSGFYQDTHPDLAPSHEWYRPTLEETFKHKGNSEMLDHIFSGGLMLREIKK